MKAKLLVTQTREIVAIVATVMAASGFFMSAFAQNAHFVGRTTATLLANNSVLVCFKEAGLGSNQLITYEATANSTLTVVCVTGGGQCPDADNKQTVSGPTTGTGEFSSGKNGNIDECIIIPVLPTPDFCPPGQTETVDLVSYTDITITDVTNMESDVATPSSLSADPFNCPNP
jgi:hypothetical protein